MMIKETMIVVQRVRTMAFLGALVRGSIWTRCVSIPHILELKNVTGTDFAEKSMERYALISRQCPELT